MDFRLSEQTVGSWIFLLLLLIAVTWIAKRRGFFKLPPPTRRPPVTWLQTGGAFFLYLVVAIIVLPLFLTLVVWVSTGSIANTSQVSLPVKGWTQFFGLIGLFLLFVLYCYKIAPESRHFIFWGEEEGSQERLKKVIIGGIAGLAVAYPYVLISSSVTDKIADWLWGETQMEQVAVNQLKMMLEYPLLFAGMALLVIFLVPFMEELLFRGFLQNLLKRYLPRGWAIALTAILFAGVHFADAQGRGNFQLLMSLLALAVFLGFVYEKYRSLWAPIALHATFNALNILAIVFSK